MCVLLLLSWPSRYNFDALMTSVEQSCFFYLRAPFETDDMRAMGYRDPSDMRGDNTK